MDNVVTRLTCVVEVLHDGNFFASSWFARSAEAKNGRTTASPKKKIEGRKEGRNE